MVHAKLYLLGPFRLYIDDQPIKNFDSNKVRALLAFLAVEAGQLHTREELAGLFWPDRPDRIALSNLRGALTNLRQILQVNHAPIPILLTTHDKVQFNLTHAIWVDVSEFIKSAEVHPCLDKLEQAAQIYQGDFLSGLTVKKSPAYEEWVLLKREQYARLLQNTLLQLIQHFEIEGEYQTALKFAWRLEELEPWNEEAQQALMRLLAVCGERSAALKQFDTFQNRLQIDLGAEPSQVTLRLADAIRRGFLHGAMEFAESIEEQSDKPPILGRETELSKLERLLQQVIDGSGKVVWVIGDTGSGKTTLMEAFASQICRSHDRVIVTWGESHERNGIGVPYQAFVQIFRQLMGDGNSFPVGNSSGHIVRRLVSMSAITIPLLLERNPDLYNRLFIRKDLEWTAPGEIMSKTKLKTDKGSIKSTQDHLSVPETYRQDDLFEDFVQSLRSISMIKPIIIILDDLQWLDNDSVDLLSCLLRHLSTGHILLIGAYRPAEVAVGRHGQQHPIKRVILDSKRIFREEQIDLDRSDGLQFINALLDGQPNRLGAAFREKLYRHTTGHALFTVELLREMQQRGCLVRNESGEWVEDDSLVWNILPKPIEAIIAGRINRLPPNLKELMNITAVEGEEFTAEVVAQVVGQPEMKVIRELSEQLVRNHQLVRLHSVQHTGSKRISRYRFRHGLFQHYLYACQDEAERAALHQAIGECLEGFGHGGSESDAATLAYHFSRAGIYGKAIRYYRQAGDEAMELFACHDAILAYRHAIGLSEILPEDATRLQQTIRLYEALIVALRVSYGFGDVEVEQACATALQLSHRAREYPGRFMVVASLKSYYDLRADLGLAGNLGEELLQIAETQNNPALLAWAHNTQGVTLLYQGNLAGFFEHSRQVEIYYSGEYFQKQIHHLGYDPMVSNLANKAWALWFQGYHDQAVSTSVKALKLAHALGHPGMLGYAMFFASVLNHYLRDEETCRKLTDETITFAKEKGLDLWLANAESVKYSRFLSKGGNQKTIDEIKDQRERLRTSGGDLNYFFSSPSLLEDYLHEGDIPGGLLEADRLLADIEQCGLAIIEPEIFRLRGELLTRSGKDYEAEAEFEQAMQRASQLGAKSWELRAAMSLLRLKKRRGNDEAVYKKVDEIYHWFTEGLQTRDLLEAQSLLLGRKTSN